MVRLFICFCDTVSHIVYEKYVYIGSIISMLPMCIVSQAKMHLLLVRVSPALFIRVNNFN